MEETAVEGFIPPLLEPPSEEKDPERPSRSQNDCPRYQSWDTNTLPQQFTEFLDLELATLRERLVWANQQSQNPPKSSLARRSKRVSVVFSDISTGGPDGGSPPTTRPPASRQRIARGRLAGVRQTTLESIDLEEPRDSPAPPHSPKPGTSPNPPLPPSTGSDEGDEPATTTIARVSLFSDSSGGQSDNTNTGTADGDDADEDEDEDQDADAGDDGGGEEGNNEGGAQSGERQKKESNNKDQGRGSNYSASSGARKKRKGQDRNSKKGRSREGASTNKTEEQEKSHSVIDIGLADPDDDGDESDDESSEELSIRARKQIWDQFVEPQPQPQPSQTKKATRSRSRPSLGSWRSRSDAGDSEASGALTSGTDTEQSQTSRDCTPKSAKSSRSKASLRREALKRSLRARMSSSRVRLEGGDDESESVQGRDRVSSVVKRGSVTQYTSKTGTGRSTGQEGAALIDYFDVHPAWDEDGLEIVQAASRGARVKSNAVSYFEHEDGEILTNPSFFQPLVRHPSSLSRIAWDFFGLCLIAYDCVMVPMEVFEPAEEGAIVVINWIIRMYWTINMPMSCMVGHMHHDGTVMMDIRSVTKRYLWTWFPLDSMVVGFHWAELLMGDNKTGGINRVGASLRSVRMMRTVRLFRLLKAPEIADKIMAMLPLSEQLTLIAEIARIMIVFLWMAHALACGWYGVSAVVRVKFPHERHWLDIHETDLMELGDVYCLSFHWALAVLSGDSQLVYIANVYERIYAMSCLFLAFVISASYVGSITTSMTRLQIIASEQSSKLAALRRFLKENRISRPLAVRVQRNAQFAMQEEKRKAPESRVLLLQSISVPVLVELHFEINSRALFTHPFMLEYNQVNPAAIRRVCHSAVSELSLSSKDVLFSELEVSNHPAMYFVMSGKVMYHKRLASPKYFQNGTQLVEAALWTKWTHCGTLCASTETKFVVLNAKIFQEVVSAWPTVHARWYAQEFVSWLNDQGRLRSDIGPSYEALCILVENAFCDESEEETSDAEDSWGSEGRVVKEASSTNLKSFAAAALHTAGLTRGQTGPLLVKKGSTKSLSGSQRKRRKSRSLTADRADSTDDDKDARNSGTAVLHNRSNPNHNKHRSHKRKLSPGATIGRQSWLSSFMGFVTGAPGGRRRSLNSLQSSSNSSLNIGMPRRRRSSQVGMSKTGSHCSSHGPTKSISSTPSMVAADFHHQEVMPVVPALPNTFD